MSAKKQRSFRLDDADIERLDEWCERMGGVSQTEVIRRLLRMDADSAVQTDGGAAVGALGALRETLTNKDEQISALNEQLSQAQRLADQAQRLHAATEQRAQLLEAEVKALPSADAVEQAKNEERQRIASMGFFARRRYLMGGE